MSASSKLSHHGNECHAKFTLFARICLFLQFCTFVYYFYSNNAVDLLLKHHMWYDVVK